MVPGVTAPGNVVLVTVLRHRVPGVWCQLRRPTEAHGGSRRPTGGPRRSAKVREGPRRSTEARGGPRRSKTNFEKKKLNFFFFFFHFFFIKKNDLRGSAEGPPYLRGGNRGGTAELFRRAAEFCCFPPRTSGKFRRFSLSVNPPAWCQL